MKFFISDLDSIVENFILIYNLTHHFHQGSLLLIWESIIESVDGIFFAIL